MYLLQIKTKDFGLLLKTEVTASTIEQLQMLSLEMVKNNPAVIGMKYTVAQYKNVEGKMISETLKVGVING